MKNVQCSIFVWFLNAPSFRNSILIKLIFLITLIVSDCRVISVKIYERMEVTQKLKR